jgi:hypothetical protein
LSVKENAALFRDLPESFKIGQPLPQKQTGGAAETVSKLVRRSILLLSSAKWRRGLGRGGAFLLGIPLSSILSPLVPHGARRKQN